MSDAAEAELVNTLRSHVTELARNPGFLHHQWYVEHHLEIVERIALELCDLHAEADRNLALILVWIHDYGKILNLGPQSDAALGLKVKEGLLAIGFSEATVIKAVEYLEMFERKMEIDLRDAPVEVRIASSADAAAHLTGPFFPIYWKEYSHKSIPELMADNRKKLKKDWERKIVLPEVRRAFEQRYRLLLEQAGEIPEALLTQNQ